MSLTRRLEKRGFAITEVESPQSPEAQVESEYVDLVMVRVDVGPPSAKCFGVVGSDVGEFHEPELSACRRPHDGFHRGKTAPGKHEALDEVLVVLGAVEGDVVDDDRLHAISPSGSSRRATGGKELVVVAPVDGLEHLDRHELRVAAFEIAVVVGRRTRDGRPRRGHALAGELELRGGDRGGGDPTSIVRRSMDREAAPASTDLEQLVVGRRSRSRQSRSSLLRCAAASTMSGRSKSARASRSSSRRASPRRSRWRCRSARARCRSRCGSRTVQPAERIREPRLEPGRCDRARAVRAPLARARCAPDWWDRRTPTSRARRSRRDRRTAPCHLDHVRASWTRT